MTPTSAAPFVHEGPVRPRAHTEAPATPTLELP